MDYQLNSSRQYAIGSRPFWLLLVYCILSAGYSFSQNHTRADTVPVKVNGNFLKNPWTGGHNYIQLSDIDMNFDGKKDLFIFDRAGHKVTTYINKGTPNTVDYVDSSFKYASKFPHLEDWAILRDYNCDGKPDIFTYAITMGGVKVWKNTSTAGSLQFTQQINYIRSDYTPAITTDPLANLYITRVDIPTVDDIDGDGDLDILTFDFSSTSVEFHINKSKELGYNCDSLIFILDPNGCWGDFQENATSCDINLSTCGMMNPDNAGTTMNRTEDGRHIGSCSLCLDMDADGDKEILIGDVSCCNMTLLTNSGTATAANITTKDITFPSSDIPVKINVFPCGYFLDVDNDNKRDLIVCPNAPNVSVDNQSVWFYKNTGADNAPVFSRVKRNLLQDQMIEVGSGADPVFFDLDADGLTDLLVSTYGMIQDSCPASSPTYGVHAFRNIGTAAGPVFDLISTDYASLSTQMSGIPGKHLTFGDIDNDGDKDLYIGDYNGNIHFLTNTAGPGSPAAFSYKSLLADGVGLPIDIGNYATPQLIDADRDADIDLIIGERAGNLNFYENIGTAAAAVFSLSTQTFGGVDVKKACCTGYSTPFMYDSAGKYNLMVGSEAGRNYPATGWIWHYKNIDANLGGNFTLADSLYNNIWEGERMMVHGADINNDGAVDLAVGNYAGGVALYMGNSGPMTVSGINSTYPDFSISPNPSNGMFNVQWLMADENTSSIEIHNLVGVRMFTSTISRQPLTINSNLPSGVYFCQVGDGKFKKIKKLVILK